MLIIDDSSRNWVWNLKNEKIKGFHDEAGNLEEKVWKKQAKVGLFKEALLEYLTIEFEESYLKIHVSEGWRWLMMQRAAPC